MKDDNYWAILSDTHVMIPNAAEEGSDAHVKTLTRAVKTILAGETLPSNAVFIGDNTQNGRMDQMQLFREVIAPLEKAGIVCHILSGNHDKYAGEFKRTFEKELDESPVPGLAVKVVKTPGFDVLCLDTSDGTAIGHYWGRLEGKQLKWLQRQIREHVEAKRPYFLCTHHPLDMLPMPKGVDSLRSAAGWICGHIHTFRRKVHVLGDKDQFMLVDQSMPSSVDAAHCFVKMRITPSELNFTMFTADGKESDVTCRELPIFRD